MWIDLYLDNTEQFETYYIYNSCSSFFTLQKSFFYLSQNKEIWNLKNGMFDIFEPINYVALDWLCDRQAQVVFVYFYCIKDIFDNV